MNMANKRGVQVSGAFVSGEFITDMVIPSRGCSWLGTLRRPKIAGRILTFGSGCRWLF